MTKADIVNEIAKSTGVEKNQVLKLGLEPSPVRLQADEHHADNGANKRSRCA
jgi:hypothetical protein